MINSIAELARCAKGFGTVGTRADAAQVIVAENTGGMAVGKRDLDGVVADRGCCLRARPRLEHRQSSCGRRARAGKGALSYPLVIASGAGAFVAKISKIVMTGVTVGPGDVDTRAAGDVNFYRRRFFAGIKRNGHRASGNVTLSCRCSNRRAGWDCHADTFSDDPGSCRSVDRVRG
jgi:hypothetical protein